MRANWLEPAPALWFAHIRADLRAHGNNWRARGFWVMVVYRFGRWRYTVRPAALRKPFSLLYRLAYKLVQVLAGIELPCEATIGGHLVIDHCSGIIVSGFARIGHHCRIRSGVVIGVQHAGETRAPYIGHHVDIGAGAKILGAIRIGNHVSIGANAVVIRDVPDNSIAVGVPSVIKARNLGQSASPVAARGEASRPVYSEEPV